jgi:hypothetical protein
MTRPLTPFCALFAAVLLAGSPASAQAPTEPPGKVGLDQLLKIPDSLEFDVEKRGGLTRSEWMARFDEARASLANARAGLAESQEKLSKFAGRKDNWNMAPPGLPVEAAESGGDTYRLRDEVRRWRAEIERSEARLRELDIEASLAGIPTSWRGTNPGSENESVTQGPAAH